jgi:hypothetical protein
MNDPVRILAVIAAVAVLVVPYSAGHRQAAR